ncbi:Ig-like domain-containing protein [Agaribacterium haliotis]|uniref:Ig-like domain-containing protein n=1 Tax=Agaribacterium haliotis TaxID=2013869 RepID=UPI000BB576FF|nr:Ig-like domain-containing protein [Agaribacterium haliotis]
MRPSTFVQSLFAVCSFALPLTLQAQTETQINLNVRHDVGGVSEFDRKKFITLHSAATENEWNGDEEKLTYLMNDLDVYLGRDNGGMGYYMNQAEQDPERPGYADPAWVASYGGYVRETVYGVNEAWAHEFDHKSDVMIGGQVHTFWPGHVTNPCCGGTGWEIAGADAMGEFMGLYLQEFYRNDGEPVTKGHPRPKLLEILNEPLYELVTVGDTQPIEVFNFHNDVAEAVRRVNSDVMIGGYTTAFPIFEEREFARWEERMQLFIDTSGDNMDFFSIHLYDFNQFWSQDAGGYIGPVDFKGARIEATLDMMEQYSVLKLGEVKPYVLSEYGGRDHQLEQQAWSPLRDWQFMKSFSPMLMQFMARPDQMLKTIPFMVTKGEWGREDGNPYPWRLLRQAFEAEGESGEQWVYTDMVKFYELWSDVNGTRVDSRSTNANVMIDTYVDGNKAYVILSNLSPTAESVALNFFGSESVAVESVRTKHLHLVGSAPELTVETLAVAPESFVLDGEATAILEYSFDAPIAISEQVSQAKYYAASYYQPIVAGVASNFDISGVQVSEFGEAVLRVSVGRDQGASLKPSVLVNGTAVDVPDALFGSDQSVRERFFGTIEIPVPMSLLKASNSVSVSFADDGGRISSVTLEVYQFSADIRSKNAPVDGVRISPASAILAVGDSIQLEASVTPYYAANTGLSFSSDNPAIATVDASGLVSTFAAGTVVITASSDEGNFSAQSVLTVEVPVAPSLSIDDASNYTSAPFMSGTSMQISTNFEAGTGEAVTGNGVTYMLRQMNANWGVEKDYIQFDSSVVGQQRGTSTIDFSLLGVTPNEQLPEGHFYFLFAQFDSSAGSTQSIAGVTGVVIEPNDAVIPLSISIENPDAVRDTLYEAGSSIDVSVNYHMGTGNTVVDNWGEGAVAAYLRLMNPDWTVVSDTIAADNSALGQESGTALISIPTAGLTPSDELADGQFYMLLIVVESSDGGFYNNVEGGIAPITIVPGAPAEPGISFDDRDKYLVPVEVGTPLEVSVNYEAGDGHTVNAYNDGVRFALRQLDASWAPVSDVFVSDASTVDTQNGVATVQFDTSALAASEDLPEGHFYYLFAEFFDEAGTYYYVNGIAPITLTKPVVPASLALDDDGKYLSTEYVEGGVMELAANFDAGTGQLVSDTVGGVQFMLREMDAGWSVINDYLVADADAIGLQSGEAKALLSLDGVTPSDELPEGNFYFLFARFVDDAGVETAIGGLFPITILADFDGDGIADAYDNDDDNDGVDDTIDDFPLDPSIGVLGDFDWDQDIDRRDLLSFVWLLYTGQAKPEYDFDGNGKVEHRDVRALRKMCTRAHCAVYTRQQRQDKINALLEHLKSKAEKYHF